MMTACGKPAPSAVTLARSFQALANQDSPHSMTTITQCVAREVPVTDLLETLAGFPAYLPVFAWAFSLIPWVLVVRLVVIWQDEVHVDTQRPRGCQFDEYVNLRHTPYPTKLKHRANTGPGAKVSFGRPSGS